MARKHTKNYFVDAIYQQISNQNKEVKKETVKSILDIFLNEMRNSLSHGFSIELRGFGVFEFRFRKGKKNARNPKTGEKVEVADHSVVAFRSGHELKESIWNKDYGK